MKNQYLDEKSYGEMLAKEDCLLYEVYEKLVPELEGELLQGMSIVHPGKVGNEYFMTKGHFHSILNTAEFYYCVKGNGYMMMENPGVIGLQKNFFRIPSFMFRDDGLTVQ